MTDAVNHPNLNKAMHTLMLLATREGITTEETTAVRLVLWRLIERGDDIAYLGEMGLSAPDATKDLAVARGIGPNLVEKWFDGLASSYDEVSSDDHFSTELDDLREAVTSRDGEDPTRWLGPSEFGPEPPDQTAHKLYILISEVRRDVPTSSCNPADAALVAEAMKRTRGTLNPKLLHDALTHAASSC